MQPTALDTPTRLELEATVPGWPRWLEATAAAVAWEPGAAAHQLHLVVRIRWTHPSFWLLAAAIAARRTTVRDELLSLARRGDLPLIHRGRIHPPADRGRRLLGRWLAGDLTPTTTEDSTT